MADRFCPSCGTEVDEDARFCPTCGMTLGEELPDLPPAPGWGRAEQAEQAEPAPDAEVIRSADDEQEAAAVVEPPEEPAEEAMEEPAPSVMAPEREPAQPPPPPLPPRAEAASELPPPPVPSASAAPPPPPGVPPAPPAPRSVAADLPFTWPETLSGWLIGAGSGIAALALIPRLGDGLSILLFVALLGVTASVFLADRLPEIPRLRLLVLLVTMIGLGMALERAAFTVRGVETLFLIAMLVAAGGALLLELDRDRPVPPPGAPRA